jgi:hypothetical protein
MVCSIAGPEFPDVPDQLPQEIGCSFALPLTGALSSQTLNTTLAKLRSTAILLFYTVCVISK